MILFWFVAFVLLSFCNLNLCSFSVSNSVSKRNNCYLLAWMSCIGLFPLHYNFSHMAQRHAFCQKDCFCLSCFCVSVHPCVCHYKPSELTKGLEIISQKCLLYWNTSSWWATSLTSKDQKTQNFNSSFVAYHFYLLHGAQIFTIKR